jgi:hypothetical protein
MIRSHLALEALCPPGRSSCHRPCKRAVTGRQAMLRGHSAKTDQDAWDQLSSPCPRAGNSDRAMRIPTN